MSRAFVSDKEVWNHCPKAGQRCLHASEDGSCSQKDCEHFGKTPEKKDADGGNAPGVQVVAREAKAAAAGKATKAAGKVNRTRKAPLKKPKKWGGRSGGSW